MICWFLYIASAAAGSKTSVGQPRRQIVVDQQAARRDWRCANVVDGHRVGEAVEERIIEIDEGGCILGDVHVGGAGEKDRLNIWTRGVDQIIVLPDDFGAVGHGASYASLSGIVRRNRHDDGHRFASRNAPQITSQTCRNGCTGAIGRSGRKGWLDNGCVAYQKIGRQRISHNNIACAVWPLIGHRDDKVDIVIWQATGVDEDWVGQVVLLDCHVGNSAAAAVALHLITNLQTPGAAKCGITNTAGHHGVRNSKSPCGVGSQGVEVAEVTRRVERTRSYNGHLPGNRRRRLLIKDDADQVVRRTIDSTGDVACSHQVDADSTRAGQRHGILAQVSIWTISGRCQCAKIDVDIQDLVSFCDDDAARRAAAIGNGPNGRAGIDNTSWVTRELSQRRSVRHLSWRKAQGYRRQKQCQ